MKQFEVIWTKNAEFDLESIIEYIKIDSVNIAKKIFFEIKFCRCLTAKTICTYSCEYVLGITCRPAGALVVK